MPKKAKLKKSAGAIKSAQKIKVKTGTSPKLQTAHIGKTPKEKTPKEKSTKPEGQPNKRRTNKESTGYKAKLARAKMQRAVTRLEKLSQGPATLNEKAAAQATIIKLKEQIAGTYSKGRTKQDVERAINIGTRVAEYTKIASDKNYGMRNYSTQFQLNTAGTETSRFSKAEVKAFYRATQAYWFETNNNKGVNINERLMRKLGIKDLNAFVKYVLAQPEVQADIQRLELQEKKKKNQMTDEEREQYERLVGDDYEPDKQGSPPVMSEGIDLTGFNSSE